MDKQLTDGTLKVQVYDKDTHNDDLLGECEVNLLEHSDSKVVSVRNASNKVGCRVRLRISAEMIFENFNPGTRVI